MTSMLPLVRLLSLLLGLLLLGGCDRAAPPGGGGRAPGDTLIIGTIGEPSTLLPVLAADSASSAVNDLVYDGLIGLDKNLNYEPRLARSWEIRDDGLTLIFHLRDDVHWHDGAPFTAADVLFTYQLYIDPKTPTAYAESFRQVDRVETPDPYTVVVRYRQPYAKALLTWATSIHPKHLLEGTDVTQSPLQRRPVGTGPYRFAAWRTGERVELIANPDYYRGTPGLYRVVLRIVPDQTTMFLELRSGNLDETGLTPLQYTRQTDTPAFRRMFNTYRYLSNSYTYLGYNLRRPLFQDKRVRQALSYAVNKQEIIDGVLLGLGRVATGPYKPGTWAYDDRIAPIPYDPQRARQLLEDAGWHDTDGDGVRDRGGQPLAFTIITNQGNEQRIRTAEILQQRFREVGVEVKVRVIEWASFLKEFVNPGNFDAVILGWSLSVDPDGYDVWHSSKTGPGELNFIGFKNAEVDALLERGRRTLDQEKRKAIYRRFQQVLAEEQPYTFLYVPEALEAVASRVQGIDPAPTGIGHNFIEWHVPPEEQRYLR